MTRRVKPKLLQRYSQRTVVIMSCLKNNTNLKYGLVVAIQSREIHTGKLPELHENCEFVLAMT